MKISVVVPVKDEEASLAELTHQIKAAVMAMGELYKHEILFVDDGSIDGSWDLIQQLAAETPESVIGIRLRRNFGKATALATGFSQVSGQIVFTMDADLQDDPKEIPRFIERLQDGYDVVSGWKRQRHDPLSKTAPSRIFNWATSRISGVNLHDFNCGFKCYRREVIDQINVYGELHRYLPILASHAGFKIGEIEVEHHARKHGKSKYGLERYARGLLDLITVMATTRWLEKPGHLFGGVGIVLGALGGAMLLYLGVIWLLDLGTIGGRPMLMVAVMLSIFSIQMISLGLIAEFFIKANGKTNTELFIKQQTFSTSASQRELLK